MAFQLIGGGGDLNTVTTTMNQNILELKGQDIRKIIRDDQGTRVAILDKNGLRTTAPDSGIDVFTATDGQLTFNSARNTLKVVYSGELVVSKAVNTTGGTNFYTHGLGYRPAVLAYIDFGDVNYSIPASFVVPTGANAGFVYEAYSMGVDESDFIVTVTTPSNSVTYPIALERTIRFYLLQETAN